MKTAGVEGPARKCLTVTMPGQQAERDKWSGGERRRSDLRGL